MTPITTYVLMVVMMSGTSHQRPVGFTQEFHSQKTCQQAAYIVRSSPATIILATCTEK